MKFLLIFFCFLSFLLTYAQQAETNQRYSTFTIDAPQLKTKKKIWVYLPLNYEKSNKKYPVIYMHDAQNLFDTAASYAGEWNIDETLDSLKVEWTQGVFYKTVMSDLSDLKDVYYDVLAFFSPTGIKSLFKNFPDFQQNNTRIAVFGETTKKEALEHGLRVDIMAPSPGTPSMTGALEKYVAEANKGK